MNTEKKVLRFEIDGHWTVQHMAQLLSHTRDLYNLSILQQAIYEDWHDMERFWFEVMEYPPFRKTWRRKFLHPGMIPFFPYSTTIIPADTEALSRLTSYYYPDEELELRKIIYGSPGFTDLTGIGEAVGHVKDFVLKIIEHFINKKQRNLENEERELRNQKLRLENAREFIKILREGGYTEAEIRKMTNWVDERQDTYIVLVDSGKLKKVYLKEENDDSENK
ncbi:MAG: hypothetical protein FJ240_11055 [Nitrospira sp.]|nr:hypothetical protein [Nitrospira sp.]